MEKADPVDVLLPFIQISIVRLVTSAPDELGTVWSLFNLEKTVVVSFRRQLLRLPCLSCLSLLQPWVIWSGPSPLTKGTAPGL